jgi:uncharacterized protein DUF4331
VGVDATAAPVQAGPCRLFIGKRSDPFFADADGVLHWLLDGATGNFQWTGKDTFAGANIFSIVLEAPNDMLGPGPGIGTWITVSLRRDGTLVQMDREGNTSFNPILNPNGVKDEFNATDPVDDVTNHLQPLAETLQRHGCPPDEAKAAALTLLPDILHYDRTRPAHYPKSSAPRTTRRCETSRPRRRYPSCAAASTWLPAGWLTPPPMPKRPWPSPAPSARTGTPRPRTAC